MSLVYSLDNSLFLVPPVFANVDADKDNSISFDEFAKVLSAREPQFVKEMFQLFDTDVDHRLNEDEYSRFIQDMNSYFSQTTDEVFNRFQVSHLISSYCSE